MAIYNSFLPSGLFHNREDNESRNIFKLSLAEDGTYSKSIFAPSIL